MGSKGKGSRMRFQPGAGAVMKQMQELQAQILQAQEQLAQETITVTVGGAVAIVMDGQQQVRSVTIHPDAVDPDAVDLLQDMIMTAVNEALKKSREMADQRMASFTAPLRMAGLI